MLRLYCKLLVNMAFFASPLSFSITEEQLTWLDQRRRHGALSRSAALRQVLDAAIAAEQSAKSPLPVASGTALVSQR